MKGMEVKMKILRMLSCIIILFILVPTVLYADSSPEGFMSINTTGENVKNGYYIIEGTPWQSGSITVNLINMSNKYPSSAVLYVADANVAVGGGMGSVTPDNAKRQSLGGWFSFTKQNIIMKPSETQNIRLQYTVPKDIKPGEYVGNVALYKFMPSKDAPKQLGKNQSQIIINKAYVQAIGILIKIKGLAIPKLSLDSFTPLWTGAALSLNLTISNPGNVIEQSHGTVIISKNNKVLYTLKGKMDSIYPGTSGICSFPVSALLKNAGNYKASIQWQYGDVIINKIFNYSIQFADEQNAEKIDIASHGIPVPINAIILRPIYLIIVGVILITLIIIIIFLLIFRRKKRYNKINKF